MDLLTREAFQYIGIPYKWGGSNPMEGFDCSGLIQWLLKSVGMDPPGDQTAQALFDHFQGKGNFIHPGKAGALCFYGASIASITHIAIMISPYQVIEAGGGDHTTVSQAVAEKQSACVRVRHIDARKDLVAKIMPDYSSSGIII